MPTKEQLEDACLKLIELAQKYYILARKTKNKSEKLKYENLAHDLEKQANILSKEMDGK